MDHNCAPGRRACYNRKTMPTCELCQRDVAQATRHHLTPREHGGQAVAELCKPCHAQIHALYTNDTLTEELKSLKALREAPEMRRFLRWVRRQRDRHFQVRRASHRR
jgi:5-methylcytosine-specific restriction protein A